MVRCFGAGRLDRPGYPPTEGEDDGRVDSADRGGRTTEDGRDRAPMGDRRRCRDRDSSGSVALAIVAIGPDGPPGFELSAHEGFGPGFAPGEGGQMPPGAPPVPQAPDGGGTYPYPPQAVPRRPVARAWWRFGRELNGPLRGAGPTRRRAGQLLVVSASAGSPTGAPRPLRAAAAAASCATIPAASAASSRG